MPSVESAVGITEFSTAELFGMGGIIKSIPQDFVVREILPNGHIIQDGSELGDSKGGLFVHCVLQKTGLDTFSAIRLIAKALGIVETECGYAGLKDADAVTFQRISLWNVSLEQIKKLNHPNIQLLNPVKQLFAVKLGDLAGNHFELTLRNISKPWESRDWNTFQQKLTKQGILNYFSTQRFGSRRPVLHMVGRLLLQQRYSEAINIYLGQTSSLEHPKITKLREMFNYYLQEESEPEKFATLGKMFPQSYIYEITLLRGLTHSLASKVIIESLPRTFTRLATAAYQSYLFNLVLSDLHNQQTLTKDSWIPLLGRKIKQHRLTISDQTWTVMLDYLEKDGLTLDSFRSKGTIRRAFVQPRGFQYAVAPNKTDVKIVFSLPKGSYGTALTRELIKQDQPVILR